MKNISFFALALITVAGAQAQTRTANDFIKQVETSVKKEAKKTDLKWSQGERDGKKVFTVEGGSIGRKVYEDFPLDHRDINSDSLLHSALSDDRRRDVTQLDRFSIAEFGLEYSAAHVDVIQDGDKKIGVFVVPAAMAIKLAGKNAPMTTTYVVGDLSLRVGGDTSLEIVHFSPSDSQIAKDIKIKGLKFGKVGKLLESVANGASGIDQQYYVDVLPSVIGRAIQLEFNSARGIDLARRAAEALSEKGL